MKAKKSQPLQVLHLEDDPDFAELVRTLLAQDELDAEVKRVADRDEFEAALAGGEFDIILSDYRLPDFTGLEALGFVRRKYPDLPFILISGTIGEHAAIESLKAGATDYVLKHNPERLASAIRRAVEETAERAKRRQAETELRRREKYFRALTEQSLDILCILSREGRFLYASPSAERVLGFAPEELHGTDALARVDSEDVPFVRETLREAVEHPDRTVKIQFRYQQKNGAWKRMELVGQNRLADPDIGGLVTNWRDVTDRWRAEEELRRSEKQYRLLFQGNPNPMWVFDLETLDVLEVNESAVHYYGYSREEFLAKKLSDLRLPEKDGGPKGAPSNDVGDGRIWRLWRKNGTLVDAEAVWSPMVFRNRLAALTMVTDVTERRQAEAALQSSEALFRSLWKNSVTGLRLVNAEGIMMAVNDAFCCLVGMEAPALEGRPFTVIYATSEDREKMLERHREAFEARRVNRKPERQYLLHDGNARTLEIIDSFIQLHERPTLMLSLFRDVTAQRQLEEQLRQSQKMEAIGQLAGGIAHDFNNILTVIQGHASLLTAANVGQPAAKSADQIKQAAGRAAQLTRQLLTFSRRQLIQPKPLDLNSVVGNMTNMLGRLLGEDVALQLNYCPTPPLVEADASMLEQVLMNLAVNARDAMPKGGQLAIRIAVTEVDAAHSLGRADARPGRFVCLSAADTGAGITPENLRRLFEPFFTTKEIGKGTGLGLATAYGIIKQHRGWIEVESQVDKGATFRIYLPYLRPKPSTAEKPASQVAVRGGSETILLVEDEAPVCQLVSRVLNKYGYNVLSAGDAIEAIEVWRNNKDRIALLLTDLVMPNHMNGRELAEKLWAERPNLKVIFTSGYSADIVGKDFKLEPELNFLQKPYHPELLATTVRRCLDGKRN